MPADGFSLAPELTSITKRGRGRPPLSAQAQINAASRKLVQILERENPEISAQLRVQWPEYIHVAEALKLLPDYVKVAVSLINLHNKRGAK